MKNLKFILFILLILSCKRQLNTDDLGNLNGYWQIAKAENASGEKKEYPINEVYDFFEINGTTGIHKKVVWQPTQKFLVNDIEENIKVKNIKEDYFIEFSNRYGSHSDKLVSINNEEMILSSTENVKYYYKKVILEDNPYGETK